MNNAIKFLIVVSVAANGFMGGLIAGHVLTGLDAKPCDCRRERKEDGPFPTGWVVPDDSEPAPYKPKPRPGAHP